MGRGSCGPPSTVSSVSHRHVLCRTAMCVLGGEWRQALRRRWGAITKGRVPSWSRTRPRWSYCFLFSRTSQWALLGVSGGALQFRIPFPCP